MYVHALYNRCMFYICVIAIRCICLKCYVKLCCVDLYVYNKTYLTFEVYSMTRVNGRTLVSIVCGIVWSLT